MPQKCSRVKFSASVLYVICANLKIKQIIIFYFSFQYAKKIGGSFDDKKKEIRRKKFEKFVERHREDLTRGGAREDRETGATRAPKWPDFANYFRMLEKINTRRKAKVHTNLH